VSAVERDRTPLGGLGVVLRDFRNSERREALRTELEFEWSRRFEWSLLADEMPLLEAVDFAEVEEVHPSSFRSDEVNVEQPATDCSGKFNSHSATVPPCPAPPKSVIPGYDWWLDFCFLLVCFCSLVFCVSLFQLKKIENKKGEIRKQEKQKP
jgi:hypothetical protein